jgi:SAM-dependent methyltransferase
MPLLAPFKPAFDFHETDGVSEVLILGVTMEGAGDVNQRFYDALWADAQLQSPERFNTWPLIRRLAETRSALEVGPGLRPRLPLAHTIFIDSSRPAVRRLRAVGARVAVGDVHNLPFRDNLFSVVAAFDIIEHFEDDGTVLDELGRMLAPGATFVFSVPLHASAWSEFDNLVGHCHRYEPHDLEHALAERGLTIIESAAYGMKPASNWLTGYGMRVMARNRTRAMRWYNYVFVPLALRFQRPLRFVPGLVDLPSVNEIIAVCRRDN